MPSPILWLVATVVMCLVTSVCSYMYSSRKTTDPDSSMTTGLKIGAYVGCCAMCLMLIGYFIAKRSANKMAMAVANGIPQLSPNPSPLEVAAANAETKLKLAAKNAGGKQLAL